VRAAMDEGAPKAGASRILPNRPPQQQSPLPGDGGGMGTTSGAQTAIGRENSHIQLVGGRLAEVEKSPTEPDLDTCEVIRLDIRTPGTEKQVAVVQLDRAAAGPRSDWTKEQVTSCGWQEIDVARILARANEQHQARDDQMLPISALFLPVSCGGLGSSFAAYDGNQWSRFPAHAVDPCGKDGETWVIRLHARLSPLEAPRYGKSEAGTPNHLVNPQTSTVPLVATFRLCQMLDVDYVAKNFRASFFLMVHWVDPVGSHDDPVGFDPRIYFENLLSPITGIEGYHRSRRPRTKELEKFWKVAEQGGATVGSAESVVREQVWRGTGVFAMCAEDTAVAPLDPAVRLTIKIRCRYPSARIVLGQSPSGERVSQTKPLDGRVEFLRVDCGKKFLTHVGPSLGCESGSFTVDARFKTQYSVAEVYNKADEPGLDISAQYSRSGRPFPLLLALPGSLLSSIGVVTFVADVGEVQHRAVINTVVVAVLTGLSHHALCQTNPALIWPTGRSTLCSCLLALAALVAAITMTDVITPQVLHEGELCQTLPQCKWTVCALSVFAWLVPTAILCKPHTAATCLYGCRSQLVQSAGLVQNARLPRVMIEMTASFLHTRWRKDRMNEFKIAVPRWKKLSAEQYKTWLERLTKQGHVSCLARPMLALQDRSAVPCTCELCHS
jgi:hypothetical protein